MAVRDRTKLTFSYTGDGNELVELAMFQGATFRCEHLSLKATALVTGVRACMLDRGQDLAALGVATIADATDTDQVFRIDDGSGGFIPVSAAGTVVDSVITAQPTAHMSGKLVLDVTASGAWTVSGWLSAIQE